MTCAWFDTTNALPMPGATVFALEQVRDSAYPQDEEILVPTVASLSLDHVWRDPYGRIIEVKKWMHVPPFGARSTSQPYSVAQLVEWVDAQW
jgi:hypothetical protein